jgi:hypothetical protein
MMNENTMYYEPAPSDRDVWAIERRLLEHKIQQIKRQAIKGTKRIREKMYLEGKLPASFDNYNDEYPACFCC